MISRRRLLQMGGLAGAGLFLPMRWNVRRAYGQAPLFLTKFGDEQALPGLGSTGIPVASPDITTPGTDTYRIVMGEFSQQLHPQLGLTKLYGYADETHGAPNHRYLGGVIVAKRGRPVKLIARNNLPGTHFLPVDTTIPGAETAGMQHHAAIHLHGGLVPWTSDGGPFSWFAPDGTHGSSFMNGTGNNGEAEYFYPNDQSARLVWYHDHALGITRLNAYAGLASAYIIRDAHEQWLINAKLIPSGPQREIPLIIQDKSFIDKSGSLVLHPPTTQGRTFRKAHGTHCRLPRLSPSSSPTRAW